MGAVRAAWAVALAALVTAGILLSVSIAHYDTIDHRRGVAPRVEQQDELAAAAMDAAGREVVGLLTVDPHTSSQDIAALLAGAAPGFHGGLRKQAESIRQSLTRGKTGVTGSVAATGVVSMSSRVAVVAVAATGTVGSGAGPDGERRNYRLTVSLVRAGQRWLVSDLRFVV